MKMNGFKLSIFRAQGLNKLMLAICLFLPSYPCLGSYGFYFGIGAGPESVKFKETTNVGFNSPFSLANLNLVTKREHGGLGPFVSLFAGASWAYATCGSDCENISFALELNANNRSVKSRTRIDGFRIPNFNHTSYKMQSEFGISFLPGVILTDCSTLYARLGYARGKCILRSNAITLLSKNKYLDGFRYGLGLQQELIDCLSLRLEANLIHYKRLNIKIADAAFLTTRYTRIKPYAQRFEIGILYHF